MKIGVRDVFPDDVHRFGGRLEKCPKHKAGWRQDCDDCGYSFDSVEAMQAYHQFCGFGPTIYVAHPGGERERSLTPEKPS
jgi:hypothetical protein